MKLTYDPRHNIAYIHLRERSGQVENICVSDELNIDMAPDGTIYGIELLNANEQLRGGDDGRIVVVDEAGERELISSTLSPGGEIVEHHGDRDAVRPTAAPSPPNLLFADRFFLHPVQHFHDRRQQLRIRLAAELLAAPDVLLPHRQHPVDERRRVREEVGSVDLDCFSI